MSDAAPAEGPHIPTAAEIRAEQNESRRRILEAIVRLLEGSPRIAKPGRLSTAALAREAEVDRARLTTGGARDLGARFAALAAARSSPTTAKEIELAEQVDKLRARLETITTRHALLLEDRDRWKAMSETLGRALNVTEREIEILERRLAHQQNGGSTDRPQLRGV
jgi:hypothetical protein